MSLVAQPIWQDHVHKATLNSATPIGVKIACLSRKIALPHNEFKKYTSKCQLLTVERVYINYAPLFNEIALVSANLDKTKAMRFYNLDEIEFTASCI